MFAALLNSPPLAATRGGCFYPGNIDTELILGQTCSEYAPREVLTRMPLAQTGLPADKAY